MMLHEQWDSPDGDLFGLRDCFCIGCLLGMVDDPSKFAGVGIVSWNVNHVKFSCLVKFSFEDLLPGDSELWHRWFEHCGLFTLEQNC